MTRDNAKGTTLAAASKIEELVNTLHSEDLIRVQEADSRCDLYQISIAISMLIAARAALRKAYQYQLEDLLVCK